MRKKLKNLKKKNSSCSCLFDHAKVGALVTENRDENSMSKKSRQNRSRDFSNFAKIIFEDFLIDNLTHSFRSVHAWTFFAFFDKNEGVLLNEFLQ